MKDDTTEKMQDKPIRNHLVMNNTETIAWFYNHQAKPFNQQRLEKNEEEVDSVSSCWRFE